MPAGLHIEYADGGPDMNILAGMRGLKYVGSLYNGGAFSVNMPDLNPSFPTYMTPYDAFRFVGHPVNGQIEYITGFSVNGTTFSQNVGGNTGGGAFAASVWQIDQSNPKSGLLIADTSDFTSIGNGKALGFCVFSGTVTINGAWTPPVPAGGVGVTVFVKFNNAGVTLHYNGVQVTCWANTPQDAYQTSVVAKVVVFVAGIEPTPQQGGLNMWNSKGECTFSSGNRPFITYGKTVSIGVGGSSTGGGMVQLCGTGGGRYARDQGNTQWTKGLGVTMGVDSVAVGWAYQITKDTDWYGENKVDYYVPGISVPVIPDIYV